MLVAEMICKEVPKFITIFMQNHSGEQHYEKLFGHLFIIFNSGYLLNILFPKLFEWCLFCDFITLTNVVLECLWNLVISFIRRIIYVEIITEKC